MPDGRRRIEVNVTGIVAIRGRDGVTRHLESLKARIAFARLVLDRYQGTTREQLADALWPERLPPTWESFVRTVVSRVRSFVLSAIPSGEAHLTARGGHYLLTLPHDTVVDVESAEKMLNRAQSLRRAGNCAAACVLAIDAAAKLRSPLLPEHEGEWLRTVRGHLIEQRLSALEIASATSITVGDTSTALALTNEALALAPLRESFHRNRMAAYVASGNRSEALRAYFQLRQLLAEELGVDPAPETEEAYLDVLSRTAPRPSPTSARADAISQGELPLVGRDEELTVLTQHWARAIDGSVQLVLLTGEPGIGKSRLAMEAARRAITDEALVLLGRARLTDEQPCQPLVEALEGWISALPEEELRRQSEAADAAASICRSWGHPGPNLELEGPELVKGLADLIVAAARDRPVLLVLDDLEWSDHHTLEVLERLVNCPKAARLLVLGATRDVRASHPLLQLARSLAGERKLHWLCLHPLHYSEADHLIRRVLSLRGHNGTSITKLRLIAASSGNPQHLIQGLGTVQNAPQPS